VGEPCPLRESVPVIVPVEVGVKIIEKPQLVAP
jgi:hypothetical protein